MLGEQTETIGSLAKTDPQVQNPTDEDVIERRGAYIDVSSSSDKPLQHRLESLLVNSSIMNRTYHPNQAGWIVDIELPTEQTT